MTEKSQTRVHSSSLSYNQQAEKGSKKSNKSSSHYISIPSEGVARVDKIGPKDDVAVTHAFCDKINIVGWVDPASLKATALHGDASDFLSDLWKQARPKIKAKKKAGELEEDDTLLALVRTNDDYKTGKKRLGAEKAATLVGIGKHNKKEGFRLRVEFNPRRLGPEGLVAIEGVFAQLFLDSLHFDRWLSTAKANRIDTACDFINLTVSDAMLRSELGYKWSGWVGPHGGLESWSHLKRKNKLNRRPPALIFYDKRLQLIQNGKQPVYGVVPHARLEVRLTQNKRAFVDIQKFKNPFSEIEIGHTAIAARRLGKDFAWFYAASQWMGVEAACKRLSPEKLSKWRLALRTEKAPFWNSNAVWAGWNMSLERDGLADWIKRAKKASI
jgi:hypothetical protein